MAFTTPPNLLPLRPTRTQISTANRFRNPAVNRRSHLVAMSNNLTDDGKKRKGETPSFNLAQVRHLLKLPVLALVSASSVHSMLGCLSADEIDLGSLLTAANPVMRVEAAAKFSKKSLSEKLSQVPVFAVTNASGQPYLAKMDGSGSQIGLIFFSHLDALNMLKDMQKNPGASDARVYIMGLDKAYEMVKAKPTPSGIRGSSGEELTMVFRFYPDSRQVKAADGLIRKLRLKQGVEGVPVFVAKGLTLRKGGETVVPLFLTKEDMDTAWAKLKETNKDMPSSAQVTIGNLLFIIQQMESGDVTKLQNVGFFPPKASVEYVASEQAGPSGQARMHQNPVAQQK